MTLISHSEGKTTTRNRRYIYKKRLLNKIMVNNNDDNVDIDVAQRKTSRERERERDRDGQNTIQKSLQFNRKARRLWISQKLNA